MLKEGSNLKKNANQGIHGSGEQCGWLPLGQIHVTDECGLGWGILAGSLSPQALPHAGSDTLVSSLINENIHPKHLFFSYSGDLKHC